MTSQSAKDLPSITKMHADEVDIDVPHPRRRTTKKTVERRKIAQASRRKNRKK